MNINNTDLRYFPEENHEPYEIQRQDIIKRYHDYITIVRTGQSGYGKQSFEITIDKKFPIDLTQDEIIDLCDWHHYGGYTSGAADYGDYWKYQASVYTD